MRLATLVFLGGLVSASGLIAVRGNDAATFATIVRPHPRPPGSPSAADVCFSTRWPDTGKRDSLKAAREFHATRLDWLYLTGKPDSDKAFVARAKAKGYPVGGTLNCQLNDAPGSTAHTFTIGRTVNMKGDALKDPWTKKYGGRFGCPNNPDYAKLFLAHARYALDAGVDYFQMDGVQLNEIMTQYGGCFCAFCVEGFRAYIASHSTPEQRGRWGIGELATFDYAKFLLSQGTDPDSGLSAWKGPRELRELFLDFQIASGLRFLGDMYQQIDQMAGRKLTYSCNANEEFLTTYHKVHNFAFIEAYPFKEGVPAFLYGHRLKPAQEMGKPYLMTFVSHDVPHNRRFIASAYAMGSNVIVPWDVFTGLDSPRFYGTPAQFADLYGFIRASAPLLDGYEEACVLGPSIQDARYPAERPPLQVYAASPVLAVVRAKPGKADAPVVVHLVATTGDGTGPLRVTFDPRRFFGARPLRMRFVAPAPYDAAAHECAEASGDFSRLCKVVDVPGGRVSMMDLPAIDPWGILVVEPDGGNGQTPWQPGVWFDEGDRSGETLDIRLDCPTPGAEIRYTLDGSAPTEGAAHYTRPVRLEGTTLFKARAFAAGGSTGSEAVARFERVAAWPRLAPDAPPLREALRLWLRADTLASNIQDGDAVSHWPAAVGPPATVPKVRLAGGAAASAPTFCAKLLNGHPGIRFDGVADLLAVADFANAHLAGKPFTMFLLTRSDDPDFGVGGNALNGGGGIPRLYLKRGAFNYDRLADPVLVGAAPGGVALAVYQHDGRNTASARVGGRPTGRRDDMPVVKAFGSGGHLAFPVWSGLSNHAGEIGEVIAYDRLLTDAEVEAIEEDIMMRYGIGDRPRWR